MIVDLGTGRLVGLYMMTVYTPVSVLTECTDKKIAVARECTPFAAFDLERVKQN